MTAATMPTAALQGAAIRKVAIPAEHGGWGFALEPALLGLLIAPSAAGAALAAAAVVAFVARTPLKVALVDRWRRRRLPRTAMAEKIAAGEVMLAAVLVGAAALSADGRFWVPLLIAAPLVAVELQFDMRSRSRALLPELSGAVGIGSIAAAIVLADGGRSGVAFGVWLLIAARAVASIPFVRVQLRRGKNQPYRVLASDAAQAGAVILAGAAVWLDGQLLAGVVAVALLGAFHVGMARRPPPVAKILGVQQVIAGLALILLVAVGVLAT